MFGGYCVVMTVEIPDSVVPGNFFQHAIEIILVGITVPPVVESLPVKIVLVALQSQFETVEKSLFTAEERLNREGRWLTVSLVTTISANPAKRPPIAWQQSSRTSNPCFLPGVWAGVCCIRTS